MPYVDLRASMREGYRWDATVLGLIGSPVFAATEVLDLYMDWGFMTVQKLGALVQWNLTFSWRTDEIAWTEESVTSSQGFNDLISQAIDKIVYAILE